MLSPALLPSQLESRTARASGGIARVRALRALSVGCAAAVLAYLATPAAAGTIRGVVLDPDERPAAAATVSLEGPGLRDERTTDPNGRFAFEGVAGRYRVRVMLDGFRALPRDVVVDAGGEIDVEISLQLSAVSETLVVTAAQGDAPLSSAPSSITVLAGTELRAQQFDDLADALRGVPGLAVARSGTRGAITSVFPRGGESDYTLVLVDGVRMNAFGGTFDFTGLSAPDIERIEVVRGPQSALYGADAIGGVVHVITRRGGDTRVGALAELGSQDTVHGTASASGSAGSWSWGAGLEGEASDGMNGERAPAGEIVGNDDFERATGTGSLGYAGRAWQLRGAFQAGRNERGYPGPFGSDPNGTYPGIDLISRGINDWLGASLATDVAVSDRVRLRGAVTWADLDTAFASPFGDSTGETQRVTGRVLGDITLGGGTTVAVGVEALGERARSTFVTGERFQPVPVTRRVLGSFVEFRAEAADRLLVTAGLRVEHITRDRLEANPSPFGGRPELGDDSVTSPNPRVAASWFLRPPSAGSSAFASGWTRLRASAGTGIRPPDAFEIAFTDNPFLKPERSQSVDAGVEQALWGGAVIAEATVFFNRYDDLIVAVGRSFADASRFRTDNISNARSAGMEVGASARLARRIDVRATYTWLDTEILAVDGDAAIAPPPFSVGDPLVRRPRHSGWVQASWVTTRASMFGRVGARGATLDVDPTLGAFGGTVPGEGYVVFDVGGSVKLWRGLEAIARLTNAFDEQYEEVVGFPALGRSGLVGARVALGR